MRGELVALITVAACGRVGFDARDDGGANGVADAPLDVMLGQPCAADVECGRCARCAGTCQAEPINDLILGHRSMCYLGAGNERWCAGDNTDGHLGLGDVLDRATPVRADDGGGWDQLFLFYYGRATGIRQGMRYRWGQGTLTPEPIGAAPGIQDILGDSQAACDWRTDGTAPGCDPSGATWRSIASGADHRCGVKPDGTLWCWGTSRDDDLGPGFVEGMTYAAPTQLPGAAAYAEVGVGGNPTNRPAPGAFSCARTEAGKVSCWGHPAYTGHGGVDVGGVPTLVSSLAFAWLQVDWERSCAGTAAGEVWCWGADTYGGFVVPGLTAVDVPTRVEGTYDRWVMGGHHACGLTGGRWRCFGWNESGQLGVGTLVNDGALTDLCP